MSYPNRWKYIGYLGTVICSVCYLKGYAQKGRIMSSIIVKIDHRHRVKGRLLYTAIHYCSLSQITTFYKVL